MGRRKPTITCCPPNIAIFAFMARSSHTNALHVVTMIFTWNKSAACGSKTSNQS